MAHVSVVCDKSVRPRSYAKGRNGYFDLDHIYVEDGASIDSRVYLHFLSGKAALPGPCYAVLSAAEAEQLRDALSQIIGAYDPVVYQLAESDIREVAQNSDIPLDKLTPEVMRATRKMVENGLEHWAETVEVALRYALEDSGDKAMRYKCVECGSELVGEADCLKHAHKHGHSQFYDRDAQGLEEPGAGPILYEPLADPELVGEAEPCC